MTHKRKEVEDMEELDIEEYESFEDLEDFDVEVRTPVASLSRLYIEEIKEKQIDSLANFNFFEEYSFLGEKEGYAVSELICDQAGFSVHSKESFIIQAKDYVAAYRYYIDKEMYSPKKQKENLKTQSPEIVRQKLNELFNERNETKEKARRIFEENNKTGRQVFTTEKWFDTKIYAEAMMEYVKTLFEYALVYGIDIDSFSKEILLREAEDLLEERIAVFSMGENYDVQNLTSLNKKTLNELIYLYNCYSKKADYVFLEITLFDLCIRNEMPIIELEKFLKDNSEAGRFEKVDKVHEHIEKRKYNACINTMRSLKHVEKKQDYFIAFEEVKDIDFESKLSSRVKEVSLFLESDDREELVSKNLFFEELNYYLINGLELKVNKRLLFSNTVEVIKRPEVVFLMRENGDLVNFSDDKNTIENIKKTIQMNKNLLPKNLGVNYIKKKFE